MYNIIPLAESLTHVHPIIPLQLNEINKIKDCDSKNILNVICAYA